jgi:hypothetical protein
MISAKGLIKVIETEGIKVKDKEDLLCQLSQAIKDKRIYIFKNKDNKEIGFVTWLEKYANSNQYIFINNLLILKEFKRQENLLEFRSFLRNKYPTMYRMYWNNRKHKKFRYYK